MPKGERKARRLAIEVARLCAENRCREVTVLDLRKLSPVAMYFVLATGTSARQMRATAARCEEAHPNLGEKPFAVEGRDTGDEDARWILIDYVHVVAHLFSEASRSYYDLELLWGDAPRVDWEKGWTPREEDTA